MSGKRLDHGTPERRHGLLPERGCQGERDRLVSPLTITGWGKPASHRFLSHFLSSDSAGVTGSGRARSGSGVARPQGAGTGPKMAVFHREKGGQQGD
ncbi:hypothetical protein A4S02_14325 (plasmid) [Acetobacter ascendens]|uniref:Uncharacterized protein n=1 Tax=Acetobacter ascendens TaxID=481146 RepID=A0A1D8R0A1_9PROT|nr:hypothetical protein A4S02_14325 [Acetobacter ascendens]